MIVLQLEDVTEEDAAIVGATLRALAHSSRCPDPIANERLQRVGDALVQSCAGVLNPPTRPRSRDGKEQTS